MQDGNPRPRSETPAGSLISLGRALALLVVRPVRTLVRRDTGANPSAGGDAGS